MNRQDYEHFASGLDDDAVISVAVDLAVADERSTRASDKFGARPLLYSTVVLTCGADLTPEPLQWLWPDWLALGKFHLLAGAPGRERPPSPWGWPPPSQLVGAGQTGHAAKQETC